jgi:GAF domain-containing protein
MPDRLQPGEGRAGRALAEIRPVAASDGDSPVRVQVLGAEAPIAHELNLPLLDDGRPVGVVALGRVANRTFTADELELLEHLAAQAGTAIGGAANRGRVDERNGVAANETDEAREDE